VGLTNALALEIGQYGIRVNSIHPYAVDTAMAGPEGMSDILTKYPDYLYSLSPMPIKPVGRSEPAEAQINIAVDEVSEVVAWLAGDGSSALSGAHICVDHGQLKY